MIGHIVSYSDTLGTGVIKHDEETYAFDKTVWLAGTDPEVGDEVEFTLQDDKVVTANLHNVYANQMRPVKSRMVAGLLGLTLGAIGAHRFYLGFYWLGLAQIAVTLITGGFGLLWGFTEGILLLGARIDKDAKGRSLK